MKDKRVWFGAIIIIAIIYFMNREDDFYTEAKKSYDEIEHYFVNSIDVKDEPIKSMKWIYDYSLKMEENPEEYTEEQHVLVNSLRTMIVNVGLMNSINYRDREMEEEYYNARDNAMIILFDKLQ